MIRITGKVLLQSLFLTALTVVMITASARGNPPDTLVGSQAPAVSLKDISGKLRSLDEFRGKPVVIAFISAKCPVSNDYAERIRTVAADYASRGVTFIGINSNSDETLALVKQHAARNGFRFPILKDTENQVADAYGATRTPEMFIIDASGVIRYHGRIDNSRNPATIKRKDVSSALDEMLDGKPVSIAETKAFGCLIQRKYGHVDLIKPAGFSKLISDSRGKVLVINFWATWCPPCIAEFPEFSAIDSNYRQKGVRVVGISADELTDIDDKVIPFVRKQKVKFEIAVQAVEDPQEMIDIVDKKWGGELPATFVYNRQGQRVFVRYGIIDREQLVQAIEKALKS